MEGAGGPFRTKFELREWCILVEESFQKMLTKYIIPTVSYNSITDELIVSHQTIAVIEGHLYNIYKGKYFIKSK